MRTYIPLTDMSESTACTLTSNFKPKDPPALKPATVMVIDSECCIHILQTLGATHTL